MRAKLKSKCNVSQHIHCQNCSLSELCIPFTLDDQELNQLDEIIDRKRPVHKGDKIYQDGDALQSLYAIRTGTFKTYTVNEHGEEQITGFHLPGDLLGFDAIANQQHPSFAQALETSMVCEIPYTTLDELSGRMPRLRMQILRLMSDEIKTDQSMIALLNHKNAEQRLATFIAILSKRYQTRNLSAVTFRLAMTRSDIGNYIGLTIETISRLLNRFNKNGLIKLDGKFIEILDIDILNDIAGL
jgi:CRP/FNR family transcriptional regulator